MYTGFSIIWITLSGSNIVSQYLLYLITLVFLKKCTSEIGESYTVFLYYRFPLFCSPKTSFSITFGFYFSSKRVSYLSAIYEYASKFKQKLRYVPSYSYKVWFFFGFLFIEKKEERKKEEKKGGLNAFLTAFLLMHFFSKCSLLSSF